MSENAVWSIISLHCPHTIHHVSSSACSLFDLGEFGVPIAFIGMAYIIIASPYLLQGGKRKKDRSLPMDDDGTILLGARLTEWSPAAGRTVKRSGL